jgi:hypothetical protein
MKWHPYTPPPWYPEPRDNTSDFDKFMKFQAWNERQEKKRKKIEKMAEDEKKKKEATKGKTLSGGEIAMLFFALSPIVGPLYFLGIVTVMHKAAEFIK